MNKFRTFQILILSLFLNLHCQSAPRLNGIKADQENCLVKINSKIRNLESKDSKASKAWRSKLINNFCNGERVVKDVLEKIEIINYHYLLFRELSQVSGKEYLEYSIHISTSGKINNKQFNFNYNTKNAVYGSTDYIIKSNILLITLIVALWGNPVAAASVFVTSLGAYSYTNDWNAEEKTAEFASDEYFKYLLTKMEQPL